MTIQKKILTAIVFIVLVSDAIASAETRTVEIETTSSSIKIGEPLLMNICCHHQKPQISDITGKRKLSIRIERLYLRAKAGKKETEYILMPIRLADYEEQGLTYSGTIQVFYDDTEGLVFKEPGTYCIYVATGSENAISNTLVINVLPASDLEEKALSILSEPNDFLFLLAGLCEKKEKANKVSKLERIGEECGETILAKWSAARLGIEYFRDFQKKHPSIEKFKAGLENDGIKEPLYQKACEYLTTGAQLPDEFPIREEVLWNLCSIEHIRGNFDKTISLLDELSTKYPKGIYGQKASESKAQLLKEPKKQVLLLLR